MFQTKVLGKFKTHFTFNNFFPPRKSCRLWDNVEKCCRSGQVTGDNMAHAHCMLNNQGYRHKLRMCNTYRFSAATFLARKLLIVTSYVDCTRSSRTFTNMTSVFTAWEPQTSRPHIMVLTCIAW